VENLKPQFTPGLVLSPSITNVSFDDNRSSSAEIAALKNENKDLTEKLETLRGMLLNFFKRMFLYLFKKKYKVVFFPSIYSQL